MPVENTFIREKLIARFGEDILIKEEESADILYLTVPSEYNIKILQFLYEEKELGFTFLTDICAVHYPHNAGRELCVVYHIQNLPERKRIALKVYVPSGKPDVHTASSLFASANWMERETYDFFGVNFIGHPNLIRILNVEEMDYFPLRKEYPLEDQTRKDKDDEMFGRERGIFRSGDKKSA